MIDEAKQPESPESDGGTGDVYSEGIKRDRIERAAIKQRWPIPEKYREPIMNRAITKLLDPKTEVRDFNQTLNAILKAEAQNQADEHKQQPDKLDISLSANVRIVEDDDWYGNSDRIASLAAAASGGDSNGPQPVQGRGRRKKMGKDGNGSTGGD